MTLTIIAAVAKNNAIGYNNELLFKLKGDLPRFKALTMGHSIIMGRKTFDSIGKPLPGRDNIVLTRDTTLHIPGCLVMHSLQDAIDHCSNQDKVFVIGGGDIFQLALPLTDTIIVTALDRDVEGDVYFEQIDPNQFKLVKQKTYLEEEPYRIIRYEQIRTRG